MIAASLAAYFGFDGSDPDDPVADSGEHGYEVLVAEVRALRAEVARVNARLESEDTS